MGVVAFILLTYEILEKYNYLILYRSINVAALQRCDVSTFFSYTYNLLLMNTPFTT